MIVSAAEAPRGVLHPRGGRQQGRPRGVHQGQGEALPSGQTVNPPSQSMPSVCPRRLLGHAVYTLRVV